VKYLERNLSKYQFWHPRSHIDWPGIEHGSLKNFKEFHAKNLKNSCPHEEEILALF
jgi:hypothetical protein